MPPSINVPSIPVPTATNAVQVLGAIRNYLISQANNSAARANQAGALSTGTQSQPTPSQFTLTEAVFRSVTFPTAGNDTVTIPVLMSAVFTNQSTGQTITYAAPPAATSGGTVGSTI